MPYYEGSLYAGHTMRVGIMYYVGERFEGVTKYVVYSNAEEARSMEEAMIEFNIAHERHDNTLYMLLEDLKTVVIMDPIDP
jgi:hypothetical protein